MKLERGKVYEIDYRPTDPMMQSFSYKGLARCMGEETEETTVDGQALYSFELLGEEDGWGMFALNDVIKESKENLVLKID